MADGAASPKELHELFKKYWDGKDLDGMLTLYEPDAVLIAQDGATSVGHEAIRATYEGFFALGASTIDFVGNGASFESGDLALTHGHWKMTLDGDSLGEAQTAEVARRGADRAWRYVLDNPFGSSVLG